MINLRAGRGTLMGEVGVFIQVLEVNLSQDLTAARMVGIRLSFVFGFKLHSQFFRFLPRIICLSSSPQQVVALEPFFQLS